MPIVGAATSAGYYASKVLFRLESDRSFVRLYFSVCPTPALPGLVILYESLLHNFPFYKISVRTVGLSLAAPEVFG